MSSLLPRLACSLICLAGFLTLQASAQEEIPGVPPESEYYYRIHYAKVEEILKVGDIAEREKQLVDFAKKLNPKSKILTYMASFLGQIVEAYEKAGQADKAKALQARINQMYPPASPDLGKQVLSAYEAKDYAKTLELGDKLYASNPDKQLAYILFESAVAANRAPKAAEYGTRVVEGFGAKDGFRAAVWLARHHAGQRNLSEAARYAAMAVGAYPGSVPPGWTADLWNKEKVFSHSLIGDAAYSRKDYASAIRSYGEAAKEDPKNDYPHFRIGLSQWQLQELDKAMESFARAVVLGKTQSAKAREYLEQIWKPRHNNTLDGLDALLAKARSEVNP